MDYAEETINTAHSLLPMCSLSPEQLTLETLSYNEMATPCLTVRRTSAPSRLNRQKSLLPGLLGPADMRVASHDGPLSYKGGPEPEAEGTVNEMEIIWDGYRGLYMVVRRCGVYNENH